MLLHYPEDTVMRADSVVTLPSVLGEDTEKREDSVAEWFPFRGKSSVARNSQIKRRRTLEILSLSIKSLHIRLST